MKNVRNYQKWSDLATEIINIAIINEIDVDKVQNILNILESPRSQESICLKIDRQLVKSGLKPKYSALY